VHPEHPAIFPCMLPKTKSKIQAIRIPWSYIFYLSFAGLTQLGALRPQDSALNLHGLRGAALRPQDSALNLHGLRGAAVRLDRFGRSSSMRSPAVPLVQLAASTGLAATAHRGRRPSRSPPRLVWQQQLTVVASRPARSARRLDRFGSSSSLRSPAIPLVQLAASLRSPADTFAAAS
jgi:hypothetical protein